MDFHIKKKKKKVWEREPQPIGILISVKCESNSETDGQDSFGIFTWVYVRARSDLNPYRRSTFQFSDMDIIGKKGIHVHSCTVKYDLYLMFDFSSEQRDRTCAGCCGLSAGPGSHQCGGRG